MFKKKEKVLYRLTTDERSLVRHLTEQVVSAQLAMQQLVNQIVARQGLPDGVRFNAGAGEFLPPTAPEPKA